MNTFPNPAVEELQTPVVLKNNLDFISSAFDAPLVQAESNTFLGDQFQGLKLHHLSRHEWMRPDVTQRDQDMAKTSIFMQALSDSWSSHVQFCLSPEVVWFILAHEISTHVNLHPERYRGLFTTSDKKEVISVHDDSLIYGSPNEWGKSISKFLPQIRAKVPQNAVELMLPRFSTSTEETDTATLVLFMNTLSNYFNYHMVTLCGIPAIKVAGSASDWQKVADQVELASHEFPGLKTWFSDLLPVLRTIFDAMSGHDVEPGFWADMYKYSGGCGGNSATVSGWITALFAHSASSNGFTPRRTYDWRKQSNELYCFEFPPHMAFVPFQWEYSKDGANATIPMLLSTGVFGVDFDGALSPKLGFAVLEDTRPRLK